MFVDACRTTEMLGFLEGEHFRYRSTSGIALSANEVDLSSGWGLVVDEESSATLSHMSTDFRTFMQSCMGVELTNGCSSRRIVFEITGITSHREESFKITTSDDEVKITSMGERGLLHASHYIERKLALRGGPFLAKGVIEKSPEFNPRITNTVFCASDGSIDESFILTDRYLGLMSHFGMNGVHVYISLWDYCRNSSLPELNTIDYERNISRLRELCGRTANYGIDIYLTVRNQVFSEDAPVFQAHPDVRGALVNHVAQSDKYCLCSSNPKVIACYKQSFTRLCEDVPEIGGVILIVGGEGFFHCFTRPKSPFEGRSSCPVCADHDPSVDIATLMNCIASSIHSKNSETKVFAWPYSAFTWSGEDVAQVEFISRLNDDVQLLSNFDTPGKFSLNGRSTALLDYNILDIGPSEQFKVQSGVLKQNGKLHYAKIESCVEPGWFFLPYLPLHFRWAERIKRLNDSNVPGLVTRWRFYGFTDCIPEEMIWAATWGENDEPDQILLKIARRDYGNVSDLILQGWRKLSELWDTIPSGHMIWGEREFYCKGSIYLGPAHPLIFDTQKKYDLCGRFFTTPGDRAEGCSVEEILHFERNCPPRYSSDLLFTYPFGAEAVEEAFRSTHKEWEAATNLIAEAMGQNPNDRACMELNICRMVGIHLHTAWNVVRFYRERDQLFSQPGDEEALKTRLNRLKVIADDEICNAEDALAILEKDIRIGYGYCYGQIYDTDMVKDKIRQCVYVRDVEIPNFNAGIMFHVYSKFV